MSASLLLSPPPSPAPIVPLQHVVARAYAADTRASATRRAYLSDFRSFEAWRAVQGLVAMPATAATIAVYLAALAGQGRKATTVERALARIAYAHRQRGYSWLRGQSEIARVMSGILRIDLRIARAQMIHATGRDADRE